MARRTSYPDARGAALLEAMIGLSVLLIGLVGMFHLQLLGITANQGARAKTRATAIAADLVAALERIQLMDATGAIVPTLTPSVSSSTMPAPQPFGSLLVGSMGTAVVSTATGIHDGTTPANLPPGVIPDSDIERDPFNPTLPLYQRRWTVWAYTPGGSSAPVYLVAVSVIYREKKLPQLREVVLYTQRFNQGAVLRNILANM